MYARKTDAGQGSAQLTDIDAAHSGGIVAAEGAQNFGGGKEFAFVAGLWKGIDLVENFGLGMQPHKVQIVALQLGLFLPVHPHTGALLNHRFQLCEELAMVDGTTVDGAADFDAKEATAARWIVEQFGLIAGADERSDAVELEIIGGIGLLHRESFELHKVLQGGDGSGGIAVEFVEIDEAELSQLSFDIRLGIKVEFVDVVVGEFGRHQQSAEGGLVHPLAWTDEQRDEAIGAAAVAAHPLGGEREEPAAETVYPQRGVVHAEGEGRDAVLAIPQGKMVHIVPDRVVIVDKSGFQETFHIAVPAVDAFFACLDGHRVHCTAVKELKVVTGIVAPTAFHLFGEEIVAKLVEGKQIGFERVVNVGRRFLRRELCRDCLRLGGSGNSRRDSVAVGTQILKEADEDFH